MDKQAAYARSNPKTSPVTKMVKDEAFSWGKSPCRQLSSPLIDDDTFLAGI